MHGCAAMFAPPGVYFVFSGNHLVPITRHIESGAQGLTEHIRS